MVEKENKSEYVSISVILYFRYFLLGISLYILLGCFSLHIFNKKSNGFLNSYRQCFYPKLGENINAYHNYNWGDIIKVLFC